MTGQEEAVIKGEITYHDTPAPSTKSTSRRSGFTALWSPCSPSPPARVRGGVDRARSWIGGPVRRHLPVPGHESAVRAARASSMFWCSTRVSRAHADADFTGDGFAIELDGGPYTLHPGWLHRGRQHPGGQHLGTSGLLRRRSRGCGKIAATTADPPEPRIEVDEALRGREPPEAYHGPAGRTSGLMTCCVFKPQT